MQPYLIVIGLFCLFAGIGGSVQFGAGSVTVGGSLGGVLIILGTLL